MSREEEAGRRGLLIVLSAPTGGGKTTLAHRLLGRLPDGGFSVSHTTRPPRPGERDGSDYHFVPRKAFERMRDAGEFAEWAEVHGNLYGTHRPALESSMAEGRDLILDIDVQGGLQIKRAFPEAVLVFIVPPSLTVLFERLGGRAEERDFDLAKRLRTALKELDLSSDYDYNVVNEDLERSTAQILGIVDSARLSSMHAERRIASLRGEILDWFGSHDVPGE